MRARFTTTLGMIVRDDRFEEDLGVISGILIHPDNGIVEGFFVENVGFFQHATLFLSAMDIVHFGSRIRIKNADSLAPVEDLIRVQRVLEEGRTILGQRMMTQSGQYLGRCKDVQFETKTFQTEWYFPKKFLRWGVPVPRSAILEVKQDVIVVRDLILPVSDSDTAAESLLRPLETLVSPPVSRVRE